MVYQILQWAFRSEIWRSDNNYEACLLPVHDITQLGTQERADPILYLTMETTHIPTRRHLSRWFLVIYPSYTGNKYST
jgi:hypothetical protein